MRMFNQSSQGDRVTLAGLVDDDEPIRSRIGCRQLCSFPGKQVDEILGCNG
jgi:hypothetical protein